MIRIAEAQEDLYDLRLLKRGLKELGYSLDYFDAINSTMNAIDEYARKGSGGPKIVLADHQTEGAGRKGRNWIDKKGCSVMFSMFTTIPQETIAVYADLVSLSICQNLINLTGKEILIKYPNDLVFEDEKLGGILAKNVYDDKLKYIGTNVGVGLNVHYGRTDLEMIPADYQPTSLDICTGSFNNRQSVLTAIADKLRFLSTEAEVISKNLSTKKSFDEKWLKASSIYKRKIVIIKDDKIVDSGIVTNTEIGRGVEIQTDEGTSLRSNELRGARKWISLFETDMKLRVV